MSCENGYGRAVFCYSSHTKCIFLILREAGAELKVLVQGPRTLVVEAAQHGHPASGPMTGRMLRGNPNAHEEIGGVASGSQDSPPLRSPVHRAIVAMCRFDVHQQCGLQQHERGMHMEDFRFRFAQYLVNRVPTTSLHEEAFDVGTFRRDFGGLAVQHKKIKPYAINGKLSSPCIVLKGRCHEGLGKEETTDPVHSGSSYLIPCL